MKAPGRLQRGYTVRISVKEYPFWGPSSPGMGWMDSPGVVLMLTTQEGGHDGSPQRG